MRRFSSGIFNVANKLTNGRNIKSFVLLIIFLFSTGLGVYLICAFLEDESATYVYLTNDSDTEVLDGFQLNVSGRSYRTFLIRPRETILIKVEPKFDSHLEIENISPNGAKWNVNVGGYIDSNSPGEYKILINSEGVRSSEFRYRS